MALTLFFQVLASTLLRVLHSEGSKGNDLWTLEYTLANPLSGSRPLKLLQTIERVLVFGFFSLMILLPIAQFCIWHAQGIFSSDPLPTVGAEGFPNPFMQAAGDWKYVLYVILGLSVFFVISTTVNYWCVCKQLLDPKTKTLPVQSA